MTIVASRIQNKEYEDQEVAVEVKLIRNDWLFRNKKKGENGILKEFVESLANLKSDEILKSDLVKVVVGDIWDHQKPVLFIIGFLPFVLYFICVIKFFTINLSYDIGLSKDAIIFEE